MAVLETPVVFPIPDGPVERDIEEVPRGEEVSEVCCVLELGGVDVPSIDDEVGLLDTEVGTEIECVDEEPRPLVSTGVDVETRELVDPDSAGVVSGAEDEPERVGEMYTGVLVWILCQWSISVYHRTAYRYGGPSDRGVQSRDYCRCDCGDGQAWGWKQTRACRGYSRRLSLALGNVLW